MAAYCRYVGGALDAFAPGTPLCPPTESAFVPAHLDPRAAYDGTTMRWGLRFVLDERLNRDAVATPSGSSPQCQANTLTAARSIRFRVE